ncbi:MAG: hypothetical protein KTR22_01330 [Flavobacteriaceae bacterium]|nr:hypothetical protein [Flavobacteriaceae bacterium]
MGRAFLCMLLVTLSSCQWFETEKISSETFYEEDLKTIDWEDVDQYPSFSACDHLIEKEEKKRCFESHITTPIYKTLSSKNIVAHHDLNDTVWVHFTITKEGNFKQVKTEMDSLLRLQLPLLESWIINSIDSLPTLAPAQKRSTPVETRFGLPVVIKTDVPKG